MHKIMKNSVLQLLIFTLIVLSISDLCPSARQGFDTGIIYIHKDSVFTTFVSISYKFRSTCMKVKKDSLLYNVNINGEDILCSLKLENKDTIYGKAVTRYGQSSLRLTKRINMELQNLIHQYIPKCIVKIL
jgi:hypothetical protein